MRGTQQWALAAASVMVAMALGVVLGSGPLRTALIGQHAQQVEALENERDDALTRAEQAGAQSQAVTEFMGLVTPLLVESTLQEQNVALIVVGDTGSEVVSDYQEIVTTAGGDVVAVLELTEDWFDPAQVAFRSALAAQMGAQVVPDGGVDAPQRTLEEALTAAVRPPDVGDSDFLSPPAPDTDTPGVIVELLVEAALVVGSAPDARADAVIVVIGDVNDSDETATVEGTALLASTLSEDGAAVVVSGVDGPDHMADAVRDSARLVPAVSTLSAGNTPVGRALIALVVRHQGEGGEGHFGWGEDRILAP